MGRVYQKRVSKRESGKLARFFAENGELFMPFLKLTHRSPTLSRSPSKTLHPGS